MCYNCRKEETRHNNQELKATQNAIKFVGQYQAERINQDRKMGKFLREQEEQVAILERNKAELMHSAAESRTWGSYVSMQATPYSPMFTSAAFSQPQPAHMPSVPAPVAPPAPPPQQGNSWWSQPAASSNVHTLADLRQRDEIAQAAARRQEQTQMGSIEAQFASEGFGLKDR